MQSLDVISINFWQIVISLANLIILFLILKRFLFRPVTNMMEKRKEILDEQYKAADNAQKDAENNRQLWEEKMTTAKETADEIIKSATDKAVMKSDNILKDAKAKSDSIISSAEKSAELEKNKAQTEIKKEITDISAVLAEKLLNREINTDDHRDIIDSVISKIGEDDE